MEGRPADDSNLIARAQRGDTAAYEEIVQRYQQIAFRTAYVITGSAAEAEDAAQEGFLKAYRALGRSRARAYGRGSKMPDLEHELRNLADAIAWPTTPNLAPGVGSFITSPRVGKVALPHLWGRWHFPTRGEGGAQRRMGTPDGDAGWGGES